MTKKEHMIMKWLILMVIYVVIFGSLLIIKPNDFVEISVAVFFIIFLTSITNSQFKVIKAFSSWLAQKILK